MQTAIMSREMMARMSLLADDKVAEYPQIQHFLV